MTTGTSSAQADRLYHSRTSISLSSSLTLDLAGSLTDSLGQAFTPASVRGIYVENRATTTGLDVYIGGNANSVPLFGAAADYFILEPEGLFLATFPIDGPTVTAGTGDIIEVQNPSASTAVTVDAWVWGTSA